MPKQSHLFRRGAVYYFRIVIPPDCRAQIGKMEFVKSFQTGDFARAKKLAALEYVDALAQIEAARHNLAEARRRERPK